jgi:hypothetical protein
LPLSAADDLGLVREELSLDPQPAAGVGAAFAVWRTAVTIFGRVQRRGGGSWGPALWLNPAFAEPEVALLGRSDFFPHFRITFETDPLGPIFHLDSD